MQLMGGLMDRLRGARHIEWVFLLLLLEAAVLLAGSPARQQAGQTDLERRMESVLSCVSGAGEVRVLVNDGEAAFSGRSAAGVLVVAEGASNMKVKLELQQAVCALLGVEAAQIEILAMEEDRP